MRTKKRLERIARYIGMPYRKEDRVEMLQLEILSFLHSGRQWDGIAGNKLRPVLSWTACRSVDNAIKQRAE